MDLTVVLENTPVDSHFLGVHSCSPHFNCGTMDKMPHFSVSISSTENGGDKVSKHRAARDIKWVNNSQKGLSPLANREEPFINSYPKLNISR